MPEDVGGGVVVADFEWLGHQISPKWVQNAKVNSKARKLTPKEQFQLARLGNMRYWSYFLKEAA